MLLHDSRRDARSTANGDLVLLEEQDRSLWHQDQIAEGTHLVVRALGRRNLGPYQLQAAVAAVHAEAGIAAETDWTQIAALYAILATLQPSHIVSLNHAVAVAMSTGPRRRPRADRRSRCLRRTQLLPPLSRRPRRSPPPHGATHRSSRKLPARPRSRHQCSRTPLPQPPHLRTRITEVRSTPAPAILLARQSHL